jgi:tetratricopeptide (TPR) repeat protein
MANRYLYLPGLGLIILMLTALHMKQNVAAPWLRWSAVFIISLFCITTRMNLPAWENSQRLYQWTLTKDPNNWLSHQNLSAILVRGNDPDGALAHAQMAFMERPSFASVFNLGLAHYAKGDFAKAKVCFYAALAEAETSSIHTMLGHTYLQLAIDAKAVPHLREALSSERQNLPVLITLAIVLSTSSDETVRAPNEAFEYASLAYSMTGGRELMSSKAMAHACEAQGDVSRALELWRHVMSLARLSNDAKIMRVAYAKIVELGTGEETSHTRE